MATPVQDGAVALNRRALFGTDRTRDSVGQRGGGLCVCLNGALCSPAVGVDGRCLLDVSGHDMSAILPINDSDSVRSVFLWQQF